MFAIEVQLNDKKSELIPIKLTGRVDRDAVAAGPVTPGFLPALTLTGRIRSAEATVSGKRMWIPRDNIRFEDGELVEDSILEQHIDLQNTTSFTIKLVEKDWAYIREALLVYETTGACAVERRIDYTKQVRKRLACQLAEQTSDPIAKKILTEEAKEVPQDNFAKMMKKIDSMSDDELKDVWSALSRGYDSWGEYAPGVGMDEWVSNIYSELENRNLPTGY
jgi:hypothetical protein